jgi:hypothetical protein
MLVVTLKNGRTYQGDAEGVFVQMRAAERGPVERKHSLEAYIRWRVLACYQVTGTYPERGIYEMDASDALAYLAQMSALTVATAPGAGRQAPHPVDVLRDLAEERVARGEARGVDHAAFDEVKRIVDEAGR